MVLKLNVRRDPTAHMVYKQMESLDQSRIQPCVLLNCLHLSNKYRSGTRCVQCRQMPQLTLKIQMKTKIVCADKDVNNDNYDVLVDNNKNRKNVNDVAS